LVTEDEGAMRLPGKSQVSFPVWPGVLLGLSACRNHGHVRRVDNPNTTQTLEYTKDKYNVKIRKRRVSPKVPPTTYRGRRIK
jgi:hypothetical protein